MQVNTLAAKLAAIRKQVQDLDDHYGAGDGAELSVNEGDA